MNVSKKYLPQNNSEELAIFYFDLENDPIQYPLFKGSTFYPNQDDSVYFKP